MGKYDFIKQTVSEKLEQDGNITQEEVMDLIRPIYTPDDELLAEIDLKDCVIDLLVEYVNTLKEKQQNYFSTQQLIDELCKRPEVQKISVGIYAPYELMEKYKIDSNTINSDCVLVINGSSNMSDSSSN